MAKSVHDNKLRIVHIRWSKPKAGGKREMGGGRDQNENTRNPYFCFSFSPLQSIPLFISFFPNSSPGSTDPPTKLDPSSNQWIDSVEGDYRSKVRQISLWRHRRLVLWSFVSFLPQEHNQKTPICYMGTCILLIQTKLE